MSKARDTALVNLMVKPVSEAQNHEVILRNASHWGARAGIGTEDFIRWTTIFDNEEYARDGKLTKWVLVPKDDPETVDFFASCQTFSRKVAVLSPGETSPTTEIGHGISLVFTPPKHRGNGYATSLMSLLHVALAPQRYPESQTMVSPTSAHSSVSVLYSDVGDFYSRCKPPSTTEPGWTINQSLKTTWVISDVKELVEGDESLVLPLATVSDVATTLASDDDNIVTNLLERQKSDPSSTYFAFTESAVLNTFLLTVASLFPAAPKDVPLGARVSDSGDFMIWGCADRNSVLAVTRLQATVDSFPLLLRAAYRAAEQAGCKSVEVWNLPEHLAGVAESTGGSTAEKQNHLSAFKWYGKQPERSSKIVWVLDERYVWC